MTVPTTDKEAALVTLPTIRTVSVPVTVISDSAAPGAASAAERLRHPRSLPQTWVMGPPRGLAQRATAYVSRLMPYHCEGSWPRPSAMMTWRDGATRVAAGDPGRPRAID